MSETRGKKNRFGCEGSDIRRIDFHVIAEIGEIQTVRQLIRTTVREAGGGRRENASFKKSSGVMMGGMAKLAAAYSTHSHMFFTALVLRAWRHVTHMAEGHTSFGMAPGAMELMILAKAAVLAVKLRMRGSGETLSTHR